MKLRTKLSLTFALIVLITVSLISLLANASINSEFMKYIQKKQDQRTKEIVADISAQFNAMANAWNIDFVHTIGMYALYDGYIIEVVDLQGNVVWDARECNRPACMQVMNDIIQSMTAKYPNMNGEFSDKAFTLAQNGRIAGTVNISYFGPYFLSENDYHFLDSLNTVLLATGTASLVLSVIVGIYMAGRISAPIGKATEAARQMAAGDFAARVKVFGSTKELAELSDSVNHLAQALSYQESLRKQLTADIAHELRTPITSVQTHLEAMIDGMWSASKERLVGCHEEVERIGTIVRDLENLAKVDNAITPDKKPVSLLRVAEKAVAGFAADIQSRGLCVTVGGDAPDVPVDEDRIRQVAANLLSNAVKYTPQGGRISITLSQSEKYALLCVADNGMGIPENELPFIFERFYRADKSRNRKTGGSGIGLAVVKAIVEAHGGKIEVESRPGSGSCFKVMLPLEA